MLHFDAKRYIFTKQNKKHTSSFNYLSLSKTHKSKQKNQNFIKIEKGKMNKKNWIIFLCAKQNNEIKLLKEKKHTNTNTQLFLREYFAIQNIVMKMLRLTQINLVF